MPAPDQSAPPPVPVGTSTVAGYSVTAVAFVMALLAFVGGDHSQAITGTIVAGSVGAVAFVVTQVGRYAQAHALAKGKSAPPLSVTVQPPTANLERDLAQALIDAAEAAGRAAALRAVELAPRGGTVLHNGVDIQTADFRGDGLPDDEEEDEAPPPVDAEATEPEPPVPDVEVTDHHLAGDARADVSVRPHPPVQPSQVGLIDPGEIEAPADGAGDR